MHFLTAARTFKIKVPSNFAHSFFQSYALKILYEKAFIKLDELKLSGTFSWLLLKYHFISNICVGKNFTKYLFCVLAKKLIFGHGVDIRFSI